MREVESTSFVPFLQQDAEALANDDFTAGSTCGQLAADQRHARVRRQHIDSGHFHYFWDRAASRHADAAPCRPVNRDAARGWACGAEARDYFAEKIVAGAVVGLPGIAETSGNGTEGQGGCKWHVTDRVQQVEEAVRFHIEDQIEFGGVLLE